jgi:hypothetical protein
MRIETWGRHGKINYYLLNTYLKNIFTKAYSKVETPPPFALFLPKNWFEAPRTTYLLSEIPPLTHRGSLYVSLSHDQLFQPWP